MSRLFAFLICLFAFSCQQSDNGTARSMAVSMPHRADYETVTTEEVQAAAVVAPVEQAAPEAPIEQKIIRNAALTFETSDMEETYRQIVSSAKKYNAQVQNDYETKDNNQVNRHLTVRIPNQHFDAFLGDVGKGVSYFDRKEISSSDVTEQFIDTEARLNAKKKLEARYLELLGKAVKVSEMLEIERQLAGVREEIEAKEGQLRYLKDRVALSTVNIDFYKTVVTKGRVSVSFGTKLWNAVKTGFNSISLFFIELVNNWPLILILVGLIWWLRRKFRKRKNP